MVSLVVTTGFFLSKVKSCFLFKIDYLDFDNDTFNYLSMSFSLFFLNETDWKLKFYFIIKNYSYGYSVGHIMIYVNCIFEYRNGIVCISVILLKFRLKTFLDAYLRFLLYYKELGIVLSIMNFSNTVRGDQI